MARVVTTVAGLGVLGLSTYTTGSSTACRCLSIWGLQRGVV